jgi:hypothetical protein
LDVKQNSGCTASTIFPLTQIEWVTSESVNGLLKSQKRASPSDIAGETLPDLINSPIQRAESGMKRFCREGGTHSKTIQTRKTNGDAPSSE